jgi:UPF0755 protein
MTERRYTKYARDDRSRPSRRRPKRTKSRGGWLVLLAVAAGVAGIAWAVGSRGGSDEVAQPATTTEAPPVKVTIPEGLRREEIAALVAEKTHLSADAYLTATGKGAEGQRRAGTKQPTSLEGFIFPATFDVGSRLTERELVQSQLQAYDTWTADVNYAYARSKNLTKFDVLILASLVEREVRVPAERPIVAGIMYNRLKRQMRLDIDATVQYAVSSTEWKRDLTAADLAIDSPYNTRKYPGLPPGPICNPGLASIAAAAKPKVSDFLYYVARDDGSGRHYFARTPEEFEAAVAKARANRGE